MAANPKVFFDMTIGGKAAGRITMELFAGTSVYEVRLLKIRSQNAALHAFPAHHTYFPHSQLYSEMTQSCCCAVCFACS
jgi:hypothetical protein